ncbi:Ubiquitin-conjugating enzyme E2 T, partial [Coelomomyces lativittatus]
MSDKLKLSRYLARIRKEIETLQSHSSEGITAWPRNEDEVIQLSKETDHGQRSGIWIDALITPPSNTPYAQGTFKVECCLTQSFPFSPPHCKFITPIYHPNIDSHGRICVDILKEGIEPGKWKVTYNVLTVLSVIRQLLAEPNPDDPLEATI